MAVILIRQLWAFTLALALALAIALAPLDQVLLSNISDSTVYERREVPSYLDMNKCCDVATAHGGALLHFRKVKNYSVWLSQRTWKEVGLDFSVFHLGKHLPHPNLGGSTSLILIFVSCLVSGQPINPRKKVDTRGKIMLQLT